MTWLAYALFAVAAAAFIGLLPRWGMQQFGPTGDHGRSFLMSDRSLWTLVGVGIVLFVGGLATGSPAFMLAGLVLAAAELVTLRMYRNRRRS